MTTAQDSAHLLLDEFPFTLLGVDDTRSGGGVAIPSEGFSIGLVMGLSGVNDSKLIVADLLLIVSVSPLGDDIPLSFIVLADLLIE